MLGITWSVGVTTVPERRLTYLPATLASIRAAGWDQLRLFVDGACMSDGYHDLPGCALTLHYPKVGAAQNWHLALLEMFLRDPDVTHYLIFQDDVAVVRNLRQYLECRPFPGESSQGKYPRGYYNLYTVKANHDLCGDKVGWYLSNQLGKGALALLFPHDVVARLLESPHLLKRAQDRSLNIVRSMGPGGRLDPALDVNLGERRFRNLDGGIIQAMTMFGLREWCHNPSLVQHTGAECSALGNFPRQLSPCFPGEHFDAMQLLRSP